MSDMNRRNVLKLMAMTPVLLSLDPVLKKILPKEGYEKILDLIEPGEFVGVNVVNAPSLLRELHQGLRAKGFRTINYSDGRLDSYSNFSTVPGGDLWKRFVATNELYRNMSRESRIPLIAVAHTFSSESRYSYRESDLLRLGALNQHVDKIFFVRRGKKNQFGQTPTIISVEKNRTGPTGISAQLPQRQDGWWHGGGTA